VGILWQRSPSDAQSTPTAWLSDRDGRKKTVLGKGTAFRVGDTSATVEGIEKDALLLKVNEKLRKWRLGTSFADALNEDQEPLGLPVDEATEAPAKKKTANDDQLRSAVQIEVLTDSEGIVLRGNEKDVEKVADLLGQIGQGPSKPARSGKDDEKAGQTHQTKQLEVYRLKGMDLDSQTVLRVLQTLLAESSEVRMEIDPKNGSLIVLAPPSVHATVGQALELLRPLATETRKPDVVEPQANEAKRDDELKLRFAFRYQKWSDVLEWYAEQAGLSLVTDVSIPGTFNYTDNREYTVTEAMDLLNSVLLTKGYVLLRRERMLLVVNVADGVPPDLVPRVTIEELGQRGKYELVSVTFPLGRRDPETVRNGVSPILSAYGSAVVLPQTHQMLVTDRGGIMRTISQIIKSMSEPEP
jgi:type II secretory pathway component GspD/PulD (secretin)